MQFQIGYEGIEGLKQNLERYKVKLPKNVIDAINQWGQELRDKYKEHLLTVHTSTGYGAKRTFWRNLTSGMNRGYVSMSETAYYLSEARPHWVSIYKYSRLKTWVKRKGIPEIQGKRAIFVRNYPFISRIYMGHYPRLRVYLKIAMRRALRK